jgi:hypothetical protein
MEKMEMKKQYSDSQMVNFVSNKGLEIFDEDGNEIWFESAMELGFSYDSNNKLWSE